MDELKEGEVREITCPNCKTKNRIYMMKVGNVDSLDESEIKWTIGKIFTNRK
ncbi:MAG: hypothetical protein KGH95_03855 [Thaumarchaeota archaeon]|nr:hypothetical protein [Nitrososphaerota archaeon]